MLATRLEMRSRTALSYHSQGFVAHFGKIVTDCCMASKTFSSLQEELLVGRGSKKYVNIVEVSSTTKFGFGIIYLDFGWKLFHSGAKLTESVQMRVGILISFHLSNSVFD